MGTRERIMQAAASVIRSRGLVRATTREIARAAGLSEGALYKHFASKAELFLALMKTSPTNFIGITMVLPKRAGTGTVAENLKEAATAAIHFYRDFFPIGASLFADPDLLARTQEALRARGAGPHKAIEGVAAYLQAERDRGRVRAGTDAEAAASLLLGACLQRAFIERFLGLEMDAAATDRFIDDLLCFLMRTLATA